MSECCMKFAKIVYYSDKKTDVVPVEKLKCVTSDSGDKPEVHPFNPKDENDFIKMRWAYAIIDGEESEKNHFRTVSILKLSGKKI